VQAYVTPISHEDVEKYEMQGT